jgi:hypothetical protein
MELPDGTILMHGKVPYDPRKAHEYYMRTRLLKGRKKGASYTVKTDGGGTVRLSEQQLTEQKAYAAKRVSEIKTRLVELSAKLQEMKASARRKTDRKPTAADRSKTKRDARKYREKHRSELVSKARRRGSKTHSSKSHTKQSGVVELEHKIVKIRSNLRAAVAKQRALAAATKNG